MTTPRLAFEPDTLPWLDRPYALIDQYVDSLGAAVPADYPLRRALTQWLQSGYLVLRAAIPPALVDAYLADLDALLARRRELGVLVTTEVHGIKAIRDLPHDAFEHPHLRVQNFHNLSVAGKHLALAPPIVDFLGHVFRDAVVAMQSLTFFHGSEQTTHQDYAYVTASPPSHLAAAWIALEDVSLDAGPLGYWAGSHAIDKFDWQPGLLWSPQAAASHAEFAAHIERQCADAGLECRSFPARKGDVFIWHGALAHRGLPARRAGLTRKSLVVHYSSRTAYPRDPRDPQAVPAEWHLNGALLYANPLDPGEENIFPLPAGL